MDENSDPVNRWAYVVPLYTKFIKCISVFFTLFKNDTVNHKVVLIFMLCQRFDLLRLLWEKRRKELSLI